MFSAGLGSLNSLHAKKGDPEPGMVVVKIGGPAYRIGMGGGAASSRASGEADAELDFNAVQRGDAEMENKLKCVRACVRGLGWRGVVAWGVDHGMDVCVCVCVCDGDGDPVSLFFVSFLSRPD
jgi:phosphoribosylformylglycinamidine (FGAM) synthase-like enzyme